MTRTVVVTLLIGLLWASPLLLAVVLGGLWMHEHGWLWQWGAVLLAAWLAAQGLFWWLKTAAPQPLPLPAVEPDESWPPADRAAWAEIERLADEAEREVIPWNDVQAYQKWLFRVFDVVARQHFPHSPQPHLEVRVPDMLAIVAQVANDLRGLADRLPGSHIFTVRELLWYHQAASRGVWWSTLASNAYRLARPLWNPVGSLLAEAGGLGFRSIWNWFQIDFQRRLQGHALRLTGRYALDLYAGRMALRPAELSPFVTAASNSDLARALRADEQRLAEPLRVLVLGQTKAGKSSLINALFGELRAATGVAPCTPAFTPYVWQHDELGQAVVLDSAGYEDPQAAAALEADLSREAMRADVILLVLSARSAARQADCRMMTAIRKAFEQVPSRSAPAQAVVLTHVDQLSPFVEWNPPYDLNGEQPKARSMRGAIDAVAHDLQVECSRIVPVCLAPGRLYNVAEGLIPLLISMLPAAQASRLARTTKTAAEEVRWSKLIDQALATGRILKRLAVEREGAREAPPGRS